MSDISTEFKTQGAVDVITARLITSNGDVVDIVKMLADITLYEDLFSNTMSGYLMIQDSIDLINTLPLIGQELFELELRTPLLGDEATIKKIFYVYKLQSRTSKKRSQNYILNFCSKELITSSCSKVSQAYSGKISKTINDIFTSERYISSNAKVIYEETKNSYSFIAPFWTPFETINWLAAKSLNSSDVPNYLFYETNKSYEYISVDTLINSSPKVDYTVADVDANTSIGSTGSLDDKYKIVLSLDTGVVFDYLKNLSSGMLASKLYTFDLTTKAANVSTIDYVKDFKKSKHLNSFPLKNSNLTKKTVSSLHFIEKNNYRSGGYDSQIYKSTYLQRSALLDQLSAFKMTVKVHGRTDLKIGDTINLKMNQFRQLTEEEINEEIYSRYFTGKYLITAIRHQILSGVHTMYMEIISDSFVNELLIRKL